MTAEFPFRMIPTIQQLHDLHFLKNCMRIIKLYDIDFIPITKQRLSEYTMTYM
jgi:hypothetical protein